MVSGKNFKTIGPYDMYNYDSSNSIPTSQPQLTSLSVEQRVTSALMFVTASRNVTLYVLEGHGEQTLDSLGLTTAVGNENYAVKSLSLLTAAAVPPDADVLLILAPKTDLTTQDADKVRAYLAQGGRAAILFNVLTKGNELPNLAGILQSYGVAVRNVVVVEGDQNKVAAQQPLWIIPSLEYHDILAPLRTNNYEVVLPNAQVIQTLDLKKKSLKIEPLLSSSSNSWGKPDIANAKTPLKEKGDLQGPFSLAVAVTDPAQDPAKKDTKLVVVGDVQFLAQVFTSQVPGQRGLLHEQPCLAAGTEGEHHHPGQEPAADPPLPEQPAGAPVLRARGDHPAAARPGVGIHRVDEETSSMSKRAWTLVAVVVVLAAAIGGYFLLSRPKPAPAAAAAKPVELSAGDKDKLVKVVLTDRAEGTLTLTRTGATWAIEPRSRRGYA